MVRRLGLVFGTMAGLLPWLLALGMALIIVIVFAQRFGIFGQKIELPGSSVLVRTSCTAVEHPFHQRYLLFIGLWSYGVLSTICFAHAAFTDLLQNLVMANGRADHRSLPDVMQLCSMLNLQG